MNLESKIYVAGHNGMVGSAIVRKLESLGYSNIIKFSFDELDLRRQSDVENMFEMENPEYVFLAAAKVGGILANNTYKAEFIYDNLAIAMNIIHASYKYGVKKLINLGSSCIYPKFAPQPMKEEYLLTGELEPTNDAYAIAKITALKLCNFYHQQYGCEFITIMPPNLYGFGDNYNLETSHVLPALIRKFRLAKLLSDNNYDAIRDDFSNHKIGFGHDKQNYSDADIIEILKNVGVTSEKVSLWGSGEIRREFEHADDIAKAAIEVAQKISVKDIGDFLNVGSGSDISISELAEIIKSLSGFNGEIEFNSRGLSGTPVKLLDSSRAFVLGIKPEITLEEGIRKLFEGWN
ncbi:MAG: GDP-L-fucose synthase [Candidatus Kapabacteria bacterium]|nr:GDP-L-fucose synthase [Ignavibacteriota bacterium]MCW5885622.1 GDP-L-fucose synthase [Candidatus Kapabacteria bacterium]